MRLIDGGEYDLAYALLGDIGRNEDVSSNKYDRAINYFNSGEYEQASVLLNEISYKDSKEKLDECSFMLQKSRLKNLVVGDVVKLGYYEQDNDTENGKEEIEWKIPAIEENKALIISEYVIDSVPFHSSCADVAWEDSSLRSWLNGYFLNEAFGANCNELIVPTALTSEKNTKMNSGNAFSDSVFLLSTDEAEIFLNTKEERKCIPTAYAVFRGVSHSSNFSKDGLDTCCWWLRSSGRRQSCVAWVKFGGIIDYNGCACNENYNGVRPALWINLNN